MLKGKADWKDEPESAFDAETDKSAFRRYEDACERVKAFYREQHGAGPPLPCADLEPTRQKNKPSRSTWPRDPSSRKRSALV